MKLYRNRTEMFATNAREYGWGSIIDQIKGGEIVGFAFCIPTYTYSSKGSRAGQVRLSKVLEDTSLSRCIQRAHKWAQKHLGSGDRFILRDRRQLLIDSEVMADIFKMSQVKKEPAGKLLGLSSGSYTAWEPAYSFFGLDGIVFPPSTASELVSAMTMSLTSEHEGRLHLVGPGGQPDKTFNSVPYLYAYMTDELPREKIWGEILKAMAIAQEQEDVTA